MTKEKAFYPIKILGFSVGLVYLCQKKQHPGKEGIKPRLWT